MTEKDNEVVKMADGWYCMEIKVIVNKGIFTYFICKLLQLFLKLLLLQFSRYII